VTARALAAALAAALALTGCTSDGSGTPSPSAAAPTTVPATELPADPTALVRRSPDAARAAGGATYTFVLAGRQTPTSPVDRISGVGRVDFATDTAATRGDFGLASSGRQYDVVTRGPLYWLSVPPRERTGYVSTPWVSTTATVARLGMSTLGHPTTYLDVLRAADSMTFAGTETVRDVATRHYTGRMLVPAMVETLPRPLRAQTLAVFRGIPEVHLEVWLDDAGRPWRLRTRLPTAKGRPEVESAFDVTKYGPVVPVDVPDRVTPLPHMDAVLRAAGVGNGR
jgi:hypothetical protein